MLGVCHKNVSFVNTCKLLLLKNTVLHLRYCTILETCSGGRNGQTNVNLWDISMHGMPIFFLLIKDEVKFTLRSCVVNSHQSLTGYNLRCDFWYILLEEVHGLASCSESPKVGIMSRPFLIAGVRCRQWLLKANGQNPNFYRSKIKLIYSKWQIPIYSIGKTKSLNRRVPYDILM